MIASLLLLCPQTTAPENASTPNGGPRSAGVQDEGWVLMNGVAIQAGDEIITLKEYDQSVRTELEKQKGRISNQGDLDEISWMVAQRLVVGELEVQAGEDMGIDPAQIDRIVQFKESEQRSESTLSFVDELLAEGRDAFSWQEDETESLYQQLWEIKTLGGELPDARPTQDRHIRPGELKAIYRLNKNDLQPPEVELQLLILAVDAAGGAEQARAILEAARDRATAGEDFGDLVREIGTEMVEARGLWGLAPVPAIPEPRLREFALDGQVGDLGEILPMPPSGPAEAFVLPRIHQRVDHEPPAFAERKIQRFLRGRFSEIRRDRILSRERAELGRRAYTWLHPGLRDLRDAVATRGPAQAPE